MCATLIRKTSLCWVILLTLNSLLSPLGGFFISNTFVGVGGGLKRDRGFTWEEGGLFDFTETEVSVLHKELECKVQKLKYTKLEVMQLRIKNKSELPAGE